MYVYDAYNQCQCCRQDLWMTIEDYDEHGASLMHEKVVPRREDPQLSPWLSWITIEHMLHIRISEVDI